MKKKISNAAVLNIVLILCLIVISLFGYFYFLKVNPVDMVAKVVVPEQEAPYKFLFSIYGKGEFTLDKPEGIAYGNNRIWVADSKNKRIVVFDMNGQPLFAFGNKKSDQIKLVGPVGILVDNNRVFVADIRLRNIVEYTLDGNLVGYFGEKNVPMPAAIKKYKDMYVSLDMAGPGLVFLNSEGKIVQRTFVGQGTAEGKMEFPQDITVSGERIYVADSNNNRLQYTDNIKGPFKIVKMKDGSEVGVPHAITSANNQLFVGSATGRVVKIYDIKETLESKNVINAPDPDNIGLGTPKSIAIDNLGKVYVVDVTHSRVMVYSK